MESKPTKKAKYPRKVKGTVKQIQSGDSIIITKKNKNGNTVDHTFYLASIMAPKVGTPQRDEEPYAYDAKKWLMEKVAGVKAEFLVEYEINGRECGTLFIKDKNVNVEIAKTGFVKIHEKKKEGMQSSKFYPEIAKAVEEAKKGLGMYNEGADHGKHIRQLVYSNTPEFDAEAVLKKSIDVGKPFKAYVEYVFSQNAVNVYVETLSVVTRVAFNHIYTPGQERAKCVEAKELIEKMILNRVVGVTFQRLDDHGNLVGRIHHKNGDIDYELVKRGLSKVLIPQEDGYDKAHYKKLKDAQDIAQINQVGLWKSLKEEESKKKTKSYDPKKKNFEAKVVEIHSGDSLTVLPEGGEERRIFLASIKAPTIARNDSSDHEPWAWESKEFMRRQAIGKKVKVEMEFQREIEIKKGDLQGSKRIMEFATIFIGKKNLSVEILQKGFAKTSLSKFREDNSKYFEDLMAADTHASTKKLGVYSNKEANIYRFIDTSRNSKAAKAIYSSISAKPVLYGVVEYCFSGQRFKIRVDSENCSIAFGLIGVKIPQPDANSPTLTNISELAKNYAKNVLHQRDVALNIKYMDKRGSFLGNLWMLSGPKAKGDHFGKNILRKGYGNIQEDNVDKIDDYEDLEEAEKIAAGEQLGVWQPDVSARMTLATGDDYDAITDDIMSGTVVDMQDASNFYINLSKDQEKLEIISKKLSEYDDSSHEVLSHPIKNGTICAAKFKDDGNWYRGRVDSSIHSNDEHLYEIYFMDYGTKNDISIDNLKKIDDDLIQYPPLAHRCTLAYLSVPKGSQTFGNNASEMFKEHLWGKECSISFYDEDDYQYYVVINSGKEAKVNESINAYLLNEGFAKITNPESLPEELMEWKDYEQDAKDEQLNIWEIGGVDDQQD